MTALERIEKMRGKEFSVVGMNDQIAEFVEDAIFLFHAFEVMREVAHDIECRPDHIDEMFERYMKR